uniref:Rhabdomeric opsin n=1 Tax=Terebratalia transversa TaxID=34513 RepID=M9UTN2_TERTR|nr:rhabdomeric opsin [Terebratalia transversa]
MEERQLLVNRFVIFQLQNMFNRTLDHHDDYNQRHWSRFATVPEVAHILFGTYISIIGLLAVFGNGLILGVFKRCKALRLRPSSVLTISLLASDMAFSAVNGFPILTFTSYYKKWIFGSTGCQLYAFLGSLFGITSINTMALMAIERYLTIKTNLYLMHSGTFKRNLVFVAIAWLWALLIALMPVLGWGRYVLEGFQTTCSFDYLTKSANNLSYIMFLMILGFCTPLACITTSYAAIFKKVFSNYKVLTQAATSNGCGAGLRSGREIEEKAYRTELKIIKTAFVVTLAFLLSWLPYTIVAMLGLTRYDYLISPYVSQIPVMVAKTSAIYNPIIHVFLYPKLRKALMKTFKGFWHCTRRKTRSQHKVKTLVRFVNDDGTRSKMLFRFIGPNGTTSDKTIQFRLPGVVDSEQINNMAPKLKSSTC